MANPVPAVAMDNRTRLKQWLASGEARLHPLSFSQRELWEASPVPAADVANHICTFIEVRGAISLKDCETALQRVVDRQEVLRLSILPGKTQPVQLVRSTATASMGYRELPLAQRHPEALEEVMQEIFREPFDMVGGPLFRVEMLQRSPGDFVLVFVTHHAIADGWTLGLFVENLVAAYLLGRQGGNRALPPVPLSYTAWAAADRAFWQPALLEERARFWRGRLEGAPHLWADSAEPHLAGPLQRHVSEIPADLTAALRALARTAGATLFSTLLTAFQWTLAKWTGKNDITVGTPVANRTKQTANETMGYFAGNVPLRGQVDGDKPFAVSVREGHEAVVDAFVNAMPFVELVHALGDHPTPGHHSVYRVRFALQNHPVPDVVLPTLTVKLRMRSTGTARFDLGCEVTEEGAGLEVAWLFRPTLFSEADIDTLDSLFLAVLKKVCGNPQSHASSLNT
jgi:hypothetical protein